MHYVYILYSPSSDLFYVGQSSDLETRMRFHNHDNPTGFTSKHRPWVLKKTISISSQNLAIKIERYIKKRKSRKFIITLIQDEQAVQRLIRRLS